MKFKSIRDILSFAISKEQASKEFYEDMAAHMNDSATRMIFEMLSKEEKKHVELLELELVKQGYTIPAPTELDDDIIQAWEAVVEIDEASIDNYVNALALAIQKERAAFQLYAQLVGTMKQPEFRRLLLELAEEEMRHVLQFEREYDAVTHDHQE